MQQNLIAALQTEMCDMAKDVSEKDKTISELKLEVADRSLSCEGQVTQLLWLDSIVNEKEAKLFDRDLAISALEVTLSDRPSLCDQQASTITNLYAQLDCCMNQAMMETITVHELDSFEVQYWRSAQCEQEEKFRALYSHCQSLACERDKLEDYITALSSCESKAKEISSQQQKLTKSLLALVDKEKKTKFIQGSQSLNYSRTEPTPDVRIEMAEYLLPDSKLSTEQK